MLNNMGILGCGTIGSFLPERKRRISKTKQGLWVFAMLMIRTQKIWLVNSLEKSLFLPSTNLYSLWVMMNRNRARDPLWVKSPKLGFPKGPGVSLSKGSMTVTLLISNAESW